MKRGTVSDEHGGSFEQLVITGNQSSFLFVSYATATNVSDTIYLTN